MNRNEWKEQDSLNRRLRFMEARKDIGGEDIAPTRGRDKGRSQTQEARLASIRHWGLRQLSIPDDPPPSPTVLAVMASCGKTLHRHTRAGTLAHYRQQVHYALANAGFASLWMRERAVRLVLTVERGVADMRAAA